MLVSPQPRWALSHVLWRNFAKSLLARGETKPAIGSQVEQRFGQSSKEGNTKLWALNQVFETVEGEMQHVCQSIFDPKYDPSCPISFCKENNFDQGR